MSSARSSYQFEESDVRPPGPGYVGIARDYSDCPGLRNALQLPAANVCICTQCHELARPVFSK